jgi:hypothetical protein
MRAVVQFDDRDDREVGQALKSARRTSARELFGVRNRDRETWQRTTQSGIASRSRQYSDCSGWESGLVDRYESA